MSRFDAGQGTPYDSGKAPLSLCVESEGRWRQPIIVNLDLEAVAATVEAWKVQCSELGDGVDGLTKEAAYELAWVQWKRKPGQRVYALKLEEDGGGHRNDGSYAVWQVEEGQVVRPGSVSRQIAQVLPCPS